MRIFSKSRAGANWSGFSEELWGEGALALGGYLRVSKRPVRVPKSVESPHLSPVSQRNQDSLRHSSQAISGLAHNLCPGNQESWWLTRSLLAWSRSPSFPSLSTSSCRLSGFCAYPSVYLRPDIGVILRHRLCMIVNYRWSRSKRVLNPRTSWSISALSGGLGTSAGRHNSSESY